MPDETGRDNSPGHALTRRSFLGLTAKAAAFLGLGSLAPGTAGAKEQKEDNKAKDNPWDNLEKALLDIKASEDENYKPFAQDSITAFNNLRKQLEPKLNRLSKIDEIAQSRKDKDGTPTMQKYWDNFRGSISSVSASSHIPHKDQQGWFLNRLNDIDLQISTFPDELARTPKDRKGPKYRDLSHSLNFITRETNIEMQEEGKNFICSTETQIVGDEDIDFTANGQILFEKDKQTVRKFLDKFPQFKKICDTLILHSTRYGEPKVEGYVFTGGSFSLKKDDKDNRYYGITKVNLDHREYGGVKIEIPFAHEAFGHGTSMQFAHGLMNMLTPAEIVDREILELEVMSNPDWGNQDGSISDLFKPLPRNASNSTFLEGGENIDIHQFTGIIREYPRNVLLTNYQFITSENQPKTIARQAIFDTDENSNKFSEVRATDAPNAMYRDLNHFLIDFMPKVKKEAEAGNSQAKIISWALEKFKDSFSNTKFLWDITYGKPEKQTTYIPSTMGDTSSIWANYCNFIVVNAAIYHAFLNGENSITDLFTPLQKTRIEKQVLFLRGRYRAELFAEGVAYSAYFGKRLREKTPYMTAMDQITQMLINKGS